MANLNLLSLFSGIGGLEMALRLACWPVELAYVADVDPGAGKVLAHHHPGVPNLGDITAVDWSALDRVDVLTAGFPCQDISAAGKQAGMGAGTRSGIWSHVADAIDTLRPRVVLLENVAALLSTHANRSTDGADNSDLEPGPAGLGVGPDRPVLRAIGAVLGDLSDLGFDAVWQVVSAAEVGAPHLRKRVFILAWPAADPPRFGHGHPRPACVGGVPAAAVGGTAGAGRLSLLPTPNAALGRGTGMPSVNTAERRMYAEGRRFLDDAVALLPTPVANDTGRSPEAHLAMRAALDGGTRTSVTSLSVAARLLPTPNATDGQGGVRAVPERRTHGGADHGPRLRDVAPLLPTPTATPYGNNPSPSAGAAVRPSLDGLVRDADRWGEYGPAIARWEQAIGRPAPEPTEPGTKGQPRLSPRFVEWMQGLPQGHVTDVPGISRNDALRLLGNGVVPQQGAAAVRHLAAVAPQVAEHIGRLIVNAERAEVKA